MFCSVEEAIKEFKKGKPIIVVDDETRENEGDLVIPAECATPEMVNFFISEGRGLLCTPVSPVIAKKCGFHPMVPNADENTCNFAVSVDARDGITTGISAKERSHTIQKMTQKEVLPRDFIRPGHVFPLNAKEGGVLERAGHTEASIDLCKIGKFAEVGMICEIMNRDGSMARMNDLEQFALTHDLKILTIADIILYRKSREEIIKKLSEQLLCTRFGNFTLHIFLDLASQKEHVALTKGSFSSQDAPLVRVHSENFVNDIFLEESEISSVMKKLSEEESSALVYIRHDEVERKMSPSEKGIRSYGIGAQIISLLGISKMKLLVRHEQKIPNLKVYNIEIQEMILL